MTPIVACEARQGGERQQEIFDGDLEAGKIVARAKKTQSTIHNAMVVQNKTGFQRVMDAVFGMKLTNCLCLIETRRSRGLVRQIDGRPDLRMDGRTGQGRL